MIDVSFHDAAGRILQTGRLQAADEADATLAARADLAGWIHGAWEAGTHHIADGMAVARPETGLPAAQALAVGEAWVVPEVPPGTAVLIDGEDMGTADATGLTLSFTAAGEWLVNLEPPFPWRPASCEVTVA
jgi:hypothetical protein